MAKDLDEPRKKFLMDVGDTVYLQGNARKIRSKHSYVHTTVHTNPDVISHLMEWHGKIVDLADLEATPIKGEGEEIKFKCGMHGMLLSQFWFEFPTKDKEDLEEGEEPEYAATIFCFLMVEDHMVVVDYKVCTKVYS